MNDSTMTVSVFKFDYILPIVVLIYVMFDSIYIDWSFSCLLTFDLKTVRVHFEYIFSKCSTKFISMYII